MKRVYILVAACWLAIYGRDLLASGLSTFVSLTEANSRALSGQTARVWVSVDGVRWEPTEEVVTVPIGVKLVRFVISPEA